MRSLVRLKILVSISPVLTDCNDSLSFAQRMAKGKLCGSFKIFHGYKFSAGWGGGWGGGEGGIKYIQ